MTAPILVSASSPSRCSPLSPLVARSLASRCTRAADDRRSTCRAGREGRRLVWPMAKSDLNGTWDHLGGIEFVRPQSLDGGSVCVVGCPRCGGARAAPGARAAAPPAAPPCAELPEVQAGVPGEGHGPEQAAGRGRYRPAVPASGRAAHRAAGEDRADRARGRVPLRRREWIVLPNHPDRRPAASQGPACELSRRLRRALSKGTRWSSRPSTSTKTRG